MNRVFLLFFAFSGFFQQFYLYGDGRISRSNFTFNSYSNIIELFYPPSLHEDFYKKESKPDGSSFAVFCSFGVGPDNHVIRIKSFPIIGYGNDFADSSKYWKHLLNSIDSVSKLWVFKPSLYDTLSLTHEYFKEQNKLILQNKDAVKPNGGFSSHKIVIVIKTPSEVETSLIPYPDYFYQIVTDTEFPTIKKKEVFEFIPDSLEK